MQDEKSVRVEQDGAVLTVRLNRPQLRNALNDDIRRELQSIFIELEDRSDVRIVVLSGEGSSFCAGADLNTTSYPPVEGDWSQRRNRAGTWQRLLDLIDRCPQVTVASMHGHVVGGGALLATVCDFRVVTDDIVFRIPELALGIPLTWNGIPLLAREVGLPVTRDWVMTARKVFADELSKTGWAQRVSAPEELGAATQALVDELLAIPPGPLAMTRSMFSALSRSDPGMHLGWGDADIQQWTFTEDEYRETARAYMKALKPKDSSGPNQD